jgi:hypothetical protein
VVFTTGVIDQGDRFIIASGEADLACRITHVPKDALGKRLEWGLKSGIFSPPLQRRGRGCCRALREVSTTPNPLL